VPAQRALRGLIKAWHDARDAGLPAIPAGVAGPLATEFRRAVRVGLASVPRIPGPKNSTAQHPGRELLEFCRDREDDVLRFTTDTRVWPTNNISERGVRPNSRRQQPQPPKSRRTQTAPYHHPHMGECSPGYLPPARSMNDPVT